MNKKLIIGAALGVIAIGAGVFALAPQSSSTDSQGGPAEGRINKASTHWNEPLVYQPETSGAPLDNVMKEYHPAGNGGATSQDVPQAPASGDSTGPANGGGSTPGNGGSANPGGGSGAADDGQSDDAPATPDPGNKPPMIFNPKLNHAICELIGCDDPVITPPDGLADGLCGLLDCDDDSASDSDDTIDSDIPPCKLLGNCKPINPGKLIEVDRRVGQ